MNGEVLRCKVTVANPHGLHMRPLAAFARRAAEFPCTITVVRDDRRVNGKSALELMLLAAEQGTELVLEIQGDGAPEALEALAPLLAGSIPEEDPTSS
jgi:phosphotransferase system HPr (HPr) family protein